MRMDDTSALSPSSEAGYDDLPVEAVSPRQPPRGLRFTSNVVGALFVVTDVICF
jgi:hypothetical protein